ncbi:MAG TPA: divalent-cation tolerance protein CutA [Hadesarchaea archaeon]|nr:divalent-cation tolerance protein CutA [Hadesarchaea archaeon]
MFCLTLTAVKNRAEAVRLGEKLVSEKLAACVSVIPNVTSTYQWRGKIERTREAMVMMKTSEKKIGRLIRRIKELHSYEVPEILVLRIERGSSDYLKWVEGSLM